MRKRHVKAGAKNVCIPKAGRKSELSMKIAEHSSDSNGGVLVSKAASVVENEDLD